MTSAHTRVRAHPRGHVLSQAHSRGYGELHLSHSPKEITALWGACTALLNK